MEPPLPEPSSLSFGGRGKDKAKTKQCTRSTPPPRGERVERVERVEPVERVERVGRVERVERAVCELTVPEP
mgnify:CR=1 FL=1